MRLEKTENSTANKKSIVNKCSSSYYSYYSTTHFLCKLTYQSSCSTGLKKKKNQTNNDEAAKLLV